MLYFINEVYYGIHRLVREILSFIPSEYNYIVQAINNIFPWIVLVISLLVCFFGFKIHHIWAGFIFFIVGFLLGATIGAFFSSLGVRFVLGLSLTLGILGIIFTHKLLKIQLFLINSIMIFSLLPDILIYVMPEEFTLIVSFILAIIAGLVAVKFKYKVTIITTTYLGTISAVPIIAMMLQWSNDTYSIITTILLLALGLLTQFMTHRHATIKELGL